MKVFAVALVFFVQKVVVGAGDQAALLTALRTHRGEQNNSGTNPSNSSSEDGNLPLNVDDAQQPSDKSKPSTPRGIVNSEELW